MHTKICNFQRLQMASFVDDCACATCGHACNYKHTQTAGNGVPSGAILSHMATESLSQVSAPAESEEGATLPLVLTTLAGEEIPSSKVRKYDRLEEFEDAVAECVPNVSQISTFGRTRLRPFEPTILKDPIWDTLRDCTRFNQKLRCPG